MKYISFFKTIGIILTLSPLSATAIPAIDLSRFIESDVTTMDTQTGLEWLDLTQTAGYSYYDVLGRTQMGEQYEGYRYATSGEVSELFDVFQLPFFTSMENPERGDQFIDLFGITDIYVPPGTGIINRSSRGFVEPGAGLEFETPTAPAYGVSVIHRDSGTSETIVQRGSTVYNAKLSFQGFASFLVRDHGKPHEVPEIDSAPAPIALSLLLLAALIRRERKRRV